MENEEKLVDEIVKTLIDEFSKESYRSSKRDIRKRAKELLEGEDMSKKRKNFLEERIVYKVSLSPKIHKDKQEENPFQEFGNIFLISSILNLNIVLVILAVVLKKRKSLRLIRATIVVQLLLALMSVFLIFTPYSSALIIFYAVLNASVYLLLLMAYFQNKELFKKLKKNKDFSDLQKGEKVSTVAIYVFLFIFLASVLMTTLGYVIM